MILRLETTRPRECIDLTESVRDFVRGSGVREGFCHVMALHATAGIVIHENDDPNVGVDLLHALERMVPAHDGWLHDRIASNAHAHIQAALLGPSEWIPIEAGELLLGRWQRLLLVELDGPRATRRISLRLLREDPAAP